MVGQVVKWLSYLALKHNLTSGPSVRGVVKVENVQTCRPLVIEIKQTVYFMDM